MPNTYLDKAIEAVPELGNRISLFTKKLRLAQYADSTIYSYRLKISQAVLYLKKLPDDFTQPDVDDYLTMLLDRNCYSLSFFKHTVFGLKDYYKYMTIYDCALRVSEVCSLKWIDISFERQQVFVYQGKGKKDRCVPISEQQLAMLRCFKKRYPSDDFVFKTHGRGVVPQPIKPGYVRVIMKNALIRACFDHSITIHALRHSAASHLLENGESLLDVQKRLGHVRLTTTMIYLHVANIEPMKHVRLIDTIFPPKKK